MKMRFTEMIDTLEHTKSFIKLNKINQKEIVGIILIWDEDVEEFNQK